MRQLVDRRVQGMYLLVPTQENTHVSTLTFGSVARLDLGEAGDLWCDVLGGVGGGGTSGHSLVSGRVLAVVDREGGWRGSYRYFIRTSHSSEPPSDV